MSKDASVLRDAIRGLVLAKYGYLDRPDRAFVAESLLHRPYDAVIRRLSEWFAVEEDTDLNYQVAYNYLLRSDGQIWRLELSMLGPFAALLRIADNNWSIALTGATPDLSAHERFVLSTLSDAEVVALDQGILSQPLSLHLYIAEPGETCVYQALFTDTSILPWKE